MNVLARKAAERDGSALDRVLAALADPHRRRVVEVLRAGARPAGEIAREVGLAPPAMSRHLRTLRRSGVVEESHPEFDARVRVYALRAGAMDDLKAWLEETERMWAAQLAAFKAHLEAPAPDQGDEA
ncbi:MAG TPA: metalloregulator ArsR/SmtB family transcription factor [Caulobacteraceae bacterium]|nr:metalloregulator ArsR/SmtB family transcription factor [Caulobacteraceae bacterium]